MTAVALIDYGSGNLHSANRALTLAASRVGKKQTVQVTNRPDDILKAERIVLPGVGHFADCAAAVLKRGTPFFGICVGQQLLATQGLEDGVTPGLNWIPGTVDKIQPGDGYRIPHMGWNALAEPLSHPVLSNLGPDPHVYFTHSYAYRDVADDDLAATTEYGEQMIAAVARDNMFATQFHPEKSQTVGLKILQNFLSWTP